MAVPLRKGLDELMESIKNRISTNAVLQPHSELQPIAAMEESRAAVDKAKKLMLDHASEDD
jgi:hypothetical protein